MTGRSHADGFRLAQAACVAGLLFALASVYWALGGTWLLDTIGGSLEDRGRSGDTGVLLALWAAAGLKIAAAVLPLLAIRRLDRAPRGRTSWVLAWTAATFLIMYGFLQTSVGLLLQTGAIHASADADHYALAWRAYLWDPWFLLWGLLAAAALLRARRWVRVREPSGGAPCPPVRSGIYL